VGRACMSIEWQFDIAAPSPGACRIATARYRDGLRNTRLQQTAPRPRTCAM